VVSEHAETRAETELLLCCARTHLDAKTPERLRSLLRQDLDWQYLIRTAEMHGVMPLLYSSLHRTCPEAVPKSSLHELKNRYRANVQHSFFSAAELLKLLNLFETHRIKAIPFKGPVLAASVYRDLSLRQFGDLDILVHKKYILRAGELLVSQGYQSVGDDVDDLEHDHEQVAYLEPNFYAFFQPDRKIRIDLQWRVTETYFSFSLDDERLWERLAPVSIAGKTVLTFAPMDLLLILCVHGSKHRWEKLKWVCDVAELVRVHKEQIDWRKVQQEASRLGIERMLGLGLFLAQDFLGAVLPEEIAKKVQADSRMKSVAYQIRERLFAQSDEPTGDFQRVFFYLKAKDRWQDRWRFCSRYASQFVHKAITPNSKDRAGLPLPASFFFLHYFFRPLRLMVESGRLGLARLYRGNGPAK
jgi:hypothetical protein